MKSIKLTKGDIYKGNLILVNSEFPLRADSPPPCVPVIDGFAQVRMHITAASCLRQILDIIGSDQQIVPVSGYRPFAEQIAIFEDSMVSNGEIFTRKYVAEPGCSEHQSGLAIDLGLNKENIDFICPEFPYTGICGDFRRLAARYGFVERYTGDKEAITGIGREPWHFRYVGYPHSQIMENNRMCLEEYVSYIKEFPYMGKHLTLDCSPKEIEIFYMGNEETLFDVPDDSIVETSGNNIDGHIVTIWH